MPITFSRGDIVADTSGAYGVVVAPSHDVTRGYRVRWFKAKTEGDGWHARHLTFVCDASTAAARRKAREDKTAALRRRRAFEALLVGVLALGADLSGWDFDEIEAEIARVRSAGSLAAYRCVPRTGAKHPLGALGKRAIWTACSDAGLI